MNATVDMAIFTALLWLGAWPQVANLCGWTTAVLFSYFVNSRWTFARNESVSRLVSFLRFVSLGALITLGASSGAIAILSQWIEPWPAKVVGLLIAAVLNFFAARWAIEDRLR